MISDQRRYLWLFVTEGNINNKLIRSVMKVYMIYGNIAFRTIKKIDKLERNK